MPGEAILSDTAQQAIKEFLLKPINWLSYQIDTKDKKYIQIMEESQNLFIIKRIGWMIGLSVLVVVVFSPWLIVPAMLLGWFFPSISLRAKYNNWRDAVSADTPTMVDYLIVYFSVGYNVKNSLNAVADVVAPALSEELKRLNADIEINKNPNDALDRFSERIDNPHVDTILQRLKSSWETKTSPDVFESLSDSIMEMRKLRINMATTKYKLFMVVLPILGVIGLLGMIAVPLAYTIMGQFGDISITTN